MGSAGRETSHIGRKLDLTDVFSVERLARAIEAADRLHLLDGVGLERALARAGGRVAGPRLRAALTAYTGEAAPVRSELERRALELFTHAGLSRPRVNTVVATAEGSLEVDFCWPDRRLVVEVDSYESTEPQPPSSVTAGATNGSRRPAGSGCVSPGGSQRTSMAGDRGHGPRLGSQVIEAMGPGQARIYGPG